jgi:hypothetical protein
LLGIEEPVAQMEEPFSILPMDKMIGGICLSIDEHVEWKKFTVETFGHPYAGGYSNDGYGEYTNGAAGAS